MNNRRGVEDVDRLAADGARDAGIAGCTNDEGDARFSRESRGKRMFARAGADYEDTHCSKLLKIKGLFATARPSGM